VQVLDIAGQDYRVRRYQAHGAVQREASDCEDLADRDDDIAKEEELHLSVRCQSPVATAAA